MRKANVAISILGLGLVLLLAWAPIAGADTYTYNAANQLASVQGPNGAASYTYDGDGQRIAKATAAGQTIYVRDPQGEVIAEYSSTGQLLAEYVYLDGQRLCKITHDAQGVERRVYYHQDVVGTPVAETNESGQVLVRAQYYPFGEEVIPGAASDPHKFTGKELDDESGLYYFGARYYDAHLGRFVSVDPLGSSTLTTQSKASAKEHPASDRSPAPPLLGDQRSTTGSNVIGPVSPGRRISNLLDPQSWNLYVYAENNPLARVDPDGLDWIYSQSTGQLHHVDNITNVSTLVGTGYAGHGAGLNDPAMQNVANVGPLPQGTYTIGSQQNNTTGTGTSLPASMRLIPDASNTMYGRAGFLIHGDNAAQYNSASEGCIVMNKTIRDQVGSSNDNVLRVTQ